MKACDIILMSENDYEQIEYSMHHLRYIDVFRTPSKFKMEFFAKKVHS